MKNNKKAKELAVFALFVFPAVAFVLFATDIPFVMNLYYSVFDWNGVGKSMTFVGLDNYIKIFTHDTLFWKGVRFTLKFAIFYVIIVNLLSLTVAIVMARENKVNSVGRAFYYVPYIISLTAISLIWKFILGPGFEALYTVTGWDIFNWSWLGTPKLAFYVVVIMAVWQNLGFYMVNYIAGIIAVPTELLEAARIDGCGGWQLFKNILLPLLRPMVITSLVFSFSGTVKMFESAMALTKGGPGSATKSLSMYMYDVAFTYNKVGYASVIAIVIFLICVVGSLIINKFDVKD